jgi:hypothetical protein
VVFYVMDTPPKMPPDRGWVGLGSMMQLWGGATGLVCLAMLVMGVFTGVAGWLWYAIVVPRLIVALAQFIAGMELRAVGLKALAQVRAYLGAAAIAAGVQAFVVIRASGSFPVEAVSWIMLDGVAWPLTLVLLMHRPQARQWAARLAEGEQDAHDPNRGIESTGIIMVALGASGLVASLLAAVEAARSSNLPVAIGREYAVWLYVALAGLVARSAVHLHAGVAMLRGADVERFAALVQRFWRVHWGAVLINGGVMMAAVAAADLRERRAFMMASDYTPGRAMTVVMLLTIVGLLSLWPALLRGRAQQLTGGSIADDTEPRPFARARDGGLATVGWFLCAYAACSIVPAVASLRASSGGLMEMGQLPGPTWYLGGNLPAWLGLVGVVLSGWAGLELVHVTARARLAAVVFAVATLGVAIYSRLPELTRAFGPGPDELSSVFSVFTLLSLLLSLVLPMLLLALVLRMRRGVT